MSYDLDPFEKLSALREYMSLRDEPVCPSCVDHVEIDEVGTWKAVFEDGTVVVVEQTVAAISGPVEYRLWAEDAVMRHLQEG